MVCIKTNQGAEEEGEGEGGARKEKFEIFLKIVSLIFEYLEYLKTLQYKKILTKLIERFLFNTHKYTHHTTNSTKCGRQQF